MSAEARTALDRFCFEVVTAFREHRIDWHQKRDALHEIGDMIYQALKHR